MILTYLACVDGKPMSSTAWVLLLPHATAVHVLLSVETSISKLTILSDPGIGPWLESSLRPSILRTPGNGEV